nr:MAG TPA: hypothetical protein [Caudoviricetes sp.]
MFIYRELALFIFIRVTFSTTFHCEFPNLPVLLLFVIYANTVYHLHFKITNNI